jgi:hypothetical protein
LLCFVLYCFVLPAVFSVIWLKNLLRYSNLP